MFTKIFDYLTSLFRGNGAESVPNVTEKSFPVARKPTESNQKDALTIDKRGLKCSGFYWDYPKTVWLTVLSIPMTEETNIPMTEMGIVVGNSDGRSSQPSSGCQPFGRRRLDSDESPSVECRATEGKEVRNRKQVT
ncbi:hypothetical protein OUZ56_009004 [Daphnia magna]|uniref:Uncharacterized protein n=1 Tax=Daphnia magna TaxID=35525 RepID=A0ABR0AEX7_9CRUS|nr:hypothetical protein OUZ56_009004 [Daphnia magna]